MALVLYSATTEFEQFVDGMTPESTTKQWAYWLIGHFCNHKENDRTLYGIQRFFSLDTHYNQRAIRDNPDRRKTAEVYRFISMALDLLVQEMIGSSLLTFSPSRIAAL